MKFSKIKAIEKMPEKVNTYDLTIFDTHCYFGNGILTHNCGYRGEVHVHLFNHSTEAVHFSAGDKIAQVLLMPVWIGTPIEGPVSADTERGTGGFGSTLSQKEWERLYGKDKN